MSDYIISPEKDTPPLGDLEEEALLSAEKVIRRKIEELLHKRELRKISELQNSILNTKE
jgi:hypothetical protein